MPERDLYSILGVSRGATPDEIRKAYRKLARRYHPDLNPGSKDAEAKFKEVSVAHGVLSDEKKRKLYDEFGEAALREGFNPEQARAFQAYGFGGGGGAGPGAAESLDIEDLFSRFGQGFAFGGMGDVLQDILGGARTRRGGRGPGRGRAAGRTIEADLGLPFIDALRGAHRAISISRLAECSTCGGSGRASGRGRPEVCGACGGTGQIQAARGSRRFARTCPHCGGSGQAEEAACGACDGSGRRPTAESIDVEIPAGVKDGQKIRLRGRGDAGPRGGPSGDIILRIRVEPHPHLQRVEDDIHVDLPITVGEAIRGAEVTFPTPDGKSARLRIPAGSQSGQKLRLKGLGAPSRDGERGNLIVRLLVHVPEGTGGDLTALAERMDALYPENPREGMSRY